MIFNDRLKHEDTALLEWCGKQTLGGTRCLLSIWNVDITDLAPITNSRDSGSLIPAAPAVRADDYYFIAGREPEWPKS